VVKPQTPKVKKSVDKPKDAIKTRQAASQSKLPDIVFEEPKADVTPFQTRWEKTRSAWDDSLRPIQKLDLEL
jgi:hypothetical protein